MGKLSVNRKDRGDGEGLTKRLQKLVVYGAERRMIMTMFMSLYASEV